MTIREELLSEGYTDEYIDKASKMEYQKIVDEIQNRKKSRLTRISNHLKISYYINRLIKLSAWKSTLKSGNKDINDNDINKIDSMLRAPNCPFVLFVGNKKLLKRKEFEEFIARTLLI